MSKLFWAILSFTSRLPAPACWLRGLDFEHYSRGTVMSPLIGVVLGGLTGLVFMALQPWCGVSSMAPSAVLTLALLTGGFHLNGLADVCDSTSSARQHERILEIIYDSRLGTHGGLTLIFVLLAKVLVMSELVLRGTSMLVTLAAVCVAGRGTAVLLMHRYCYAREEGLGSTLTSKVTGYQTCIMSGLAAILATVLLPGMRDVAALVVAIATIFTFGQLLKRILGGQTGDTLDTAIEPDGLIFLLVLS